MNNQGFLKLRNGLIEHVNGRQFTANDLGVYTFLHLNKNWRTGICWTNAAGVATTLDGSPHSSIKRSFERLRERNYIQYRKGDGSRANYAVVLVNDEPTHGILKGCRARGFVDNNFDVVQYEVPDGECAERIQRLAAAYPERGWCCDQSVSGAWLVRIPLPDLQDFKTFKTLPDIEEEKDLQDRPSPAGSENRKPSDQGEEPSGTGNASSPDGDSAIGQTFEPHCRVCYEAEDDCNMADKPCPGRETRAAKKRAEQKREAHCARWGRQTPEHWIKVCKGCEQEFNILGNEHKEFHSAECQTAWRERKNAEYLAAHPEMVRPAKPTSQYQLAAFLDGK